MGEFADSVGEAVWQEDDSLLGRVGTDFFESLQGADVKTAWGLSKQVSGFGNGSSSGFFALGGDDGSAAFALGFGLLGHGTLHVGRKLDVLKADALDVDAPFVGLGINNFADLGGNFVTFAENLVEVKIAGDVAKGGLGESAGGVGVIGGFEDGFGGINDAEIDDGVDIDGDVVARDDLLLRNVHWRGAYIYFDHVVDVGNNHAEAWLQDAREFAEAENDAAFVLVDNAYSGYDN